MGLLISYMGQVVSYVSQAALHVYRPYLLSSSEHHIYVRTGDKRGAGTDANVYVRLYDSDGRQSADITLDVPFRDDLERGNMDVFPCPKLAGFKDIAKIELWRDEKGIWDNWYVDYVMVQHVATKRSFYFPIHRWIRAYQHYVFKEFDSSLPQHDDEQKFRKQELLEKRQTYEFVCHYSGIPTQAKSLPADESFSNEYKWNLVARKVQMLAESAITRRLVKDWESLEDIKNMFKFKHFPLPECVNDWQTDEHFGRQRLTGLNAVAIRLCTEIPDNFAVTDDHVRPFLEGNTIEGAIGKKKLFYVDLKILEGVPTIPDKKVCAPLALFYVREDEAMVPVAIQLHQEKGPGNPVFVPSDPKYTWLLAKMWFNNADAQVHQSNTHLGLTHLIMEGVVVCTHRNLSPSHPMFKLLAPHFLYLIAINTRGLALLISEDGWISHTMTVGRSGCFELCKRGYAEWSLAMLPGTEGEFASRGVVDDGVPPGYYYRDDSLAIYKALRTYVQKIVEHFYDTDDNIRDDDELQQWRRELTGSDHQRDGGHVCVSLPGVPGEDGRFTSVKQLVDVFTAIIHTCSVGHASSNFQQYDQYGYPPNYPALLHGDPPSDKGPRSEQHVLDSLPDQELMLDIMVVTKLLSDMGTNKLSDFEVQYLFDPVSVSARRELSDELETISKKVKERNSVVKEPYPWLDPQHVPNSISI